MSVSQLSDGLLGVKVYDLSVALAVETCIKAGYLCI